MVIRVDCHDSRWYGNIKEMKEKYPNAHYEIIKRNKRHILSPSKKLLIKIGIMKKSDGTKNKKWDLSKPEVFVEYKRKLMKEFSENPFYEIRLMERKIQKKHLIFSIFDQNDVLVSIKEAPLGESPLLWSNNKQFIRLIQNAFEFMWINAIKI